ESYFVSERNSSAPLHLLWSRAVPLGDEVRFGQRLAELLCPCAPGSGRPAPRRQLRDAPHGGDLPPLRRPLGPRLRGRPGAQRAPLLHQLRQPEARGSEKTQTVPPAGVGSDLSVANHQGPRTTSSR